MNQFKLIIRAKGKKYVKIMNEKEMSKILKNKTIEDGIDILKVEK